MPPRSNADAGLLFLLLLFIPAADSLPALQWSTHLWGRLRRAGRAAPDVTRDFEYRRLIAHLPPRGSVGVVQVAPATPQESSRTFYFLQYALAPRQIVSTSDAEFVIVAGRPAPGAIPLPPAEFVLVATVDDELRVYRRIER